MEQQQVIPAKIIKFPAAELLVSQIDESATNPRRNFGDIDELARSIKRQGVLVPVIVRQSKPGRWELIAGARRVRAAKLAGRESVPGVAVECSDEEARAIQLVENSQRQDVHPMEDAIGLEQLVTIAGRGGAADPVDAVSLMTGKPRAHITRRLRLLKLPAPAQKAFLAGEFTTEHALVIVRLATKEAREKAWQLLAAELNDKNSDGLPSIRKFSEEIEDQILLELGSAQFNTADAKLVAGVGACGPCPKRSGNAQDLFGGVSGKDLCTDSTCFKSKVEATWKKRTEAAKETKQKVLTAAEAKAVFGTYSGDRPNYGSGYVKAAEQDKKVQAALLKAGKKPILAKTPSGKIAELWRKQDIESAGRTRTAGQRRPQAEIDAEKKSKAAAQARRELEEFERQAGEKLRTLAFDDRAAKLSDSDFLELVWRFIFDSKDQWTIRGIATRRKLKAAAILATKKPADRKSLLLEFLFDHFDDPDREQIAFEVLKLDLKAEVSNLKAAKASAPKKGGEK